MSTGSQQEQNIFKKICSYKITVFLTMLMCFPIGLIILWYGNAFKIVGKIIFTVIIVGIFIVPGIIDRAMFEGEGFTVNEDGDLVYTGGVSEVEEEYVYEEPEPEYADLSFSTIRSNMKNMTDVQWDNYVNEIVGSRIRWEGYIEEVKSKFWGGYEAIIDMDASYNAASVPEIEIEVDEDEAAQLEKDRKYVFVGTLNNVISIMGSCQIVLDDAEIVGMVEDQY